MFKKQWHWKERQRERERPKVGETKGEKETLKPVKTCTASVGAPAAVIQVRGTSIEFSWKSTYISSSDSGPQNARHLLDQKENAA